MKTFIKISTVLLLSLIINTQISAQRIGDLNGINYQAVAIDEDGKEIVGMDIKGKPLFEKEIGVKFSILKGNDGAIQYQETHTTLTDQYGLFSLIIGHGTQTGSGAYSDLLSMPWIDADQWLKVEISIRNDGNFKVVSLQQFMSVPYSFYTDDIADDAITTEKILNETILAEDIATGAVDTRTILDETIINEDIATGAIDSRTILNETILTEDVSTGAIDTRTILNETILAEDIATGAVTTSEILNETILAEDIATGAVTTNEILNGTILNEDIADGTIDLTGKVTGILPVPNGGTGVNSLTANSLILGSGTNSLASLGQAADGQIPIGATGGAPVLGNITAGTGILVNNTAGGIEISSTIQAGGVNTQETGIENIGDIDATKSFVTQIALPGVEPGDFVVASYSRPLDGCLISGYVKGINEIEVVIYNANDTTVNLGEGTFKVLVIK